MCCAGRPPGCAPLPVCTGAPWARLHHTTPTTARLTSTMLTVLCAGRPFVARFVCCCTQVLPGLPGFSAAERAHIHAVLCCAVPGCVCYCTQVAPGLPGFSAAERAHIHAVCCAVLWPSSSAAAHRLLLGCQPFRLLSVLTLVRSCAVLTALLWFGWFVALHRCRLGCRVSLLLSAPTLVRSCRTCCCTLSGWQMCRVSTWGQL
jgi:hypothetical protein